MALFDGAEIDETPDAAGQGALHATSTTLKMTRPAHTITLADRVVIVRNGETMRSNDAVVALTDDDERVKRMELRGQASVVQPPTASASATTMRAKEIDLDFAPSESTLTATDLRGGASVTQPATPKSKPPQMKAENIHIDFQPDGRAARRAVLTEKASLDLIGTDNAIRNVKGDSISVVLSLDGQRATALNGQGAIIVTLPESAEAPGRTINADVLDAKGTDAAGLTSAVFTPTAPSGLVSLIEDQRADAKSQRKKLHREFHARQMDLKLNGDLGAIEKASFIGSFDFMSRSDTETSKGHSGEADFDEQQGKLRLTSVKSTKRPEVDSDRLWVQAASIDVFTKTSGLNASGEVRSDLKPDTSKPASSGLFEGSQKISANADELEYDDDKGDAVYTGKAFVKQGSSTVRADRVSMSSRTSNLSASGNVQTTLTLDNAPGSAATPAAGTPMPGTMPCSVAGASCVNAAKMAYDDARRVATYTTGASLIGSGDTAMMADKITLTLAQEGHALALVTAEGSVVANMSHDQQSQGTRLVYTAATDSYVVTGVPLVIVRRSMDKGKESCSSETFSNGEMRLETENAAMKRSASTNFSSKDTHQSTETQGLSCAAVMKVIK
jgi:lipopolysaccharide export system protein LptA